MMNRRRSRARYASDDLVERAVTLAKKHGVALELGPDGSVKILGKLDSVRASGVGSAPEGETADEALATWEAKHGHPRHS